MRALRIRRSLIGYDPGGVARLVRALEAEKAALEARLVRERRRFAGELAKRNAGQAGLEGQVGQAAASAPPERSAGPTEAAGPERPRRHLAGTVRTPASRRLGLKLRKRLWGLHVRETERRLRRMWEELERYRLQAEREIEELNARLDLERPDLPAQAEGNRPEETPPNRPESSPLTRRHQPERRPTPEWTGRPSERTSFTPSPVPADLSPERAGKRDRLGELLLDRGWITEEQLAAALDQQRRIGGRLGDLLADLGYVTYEQLADALKAQAPKKRLGEMLLERGLLTREQLDRALDFQKRSGGMLGEILVSLRMIKPETLYRALATQTGIGRVGEEVRFEALPKLPVSLARELDAVVIGERPNRYLVAVGHPLDAAGIRRLEAQLSASVEQVLATREELETFWQAAYHEELMDLSIRQIMTEQPDVSAHFTFTRGQVLTAACLLAGLALGLAGNWVITLVILNCIVQGFYVAVTLFKFVIVMKGARQSAQIRIAPEEIDALDERELPVYTILVPLYKESRVIPALLEHLERLDYPKVKLDIRLLVEEDDAETLAALRSTDLPPHYSVIVVPDSYPKTKPKACNYGLIRARGEYAVIFDAEDRPEPDQLKKAYLAFRHLPERIVCLQAKLNYYNSGQNLLTRWFTTEYTTWFEVSLPGIMQLDVPIPLGGTSNHFRMEALKRLNGWDPFNVTEDADLGVRLYKEGYGTGILDSRTWEEASSRLGGWIRQRSRWIKGYMQTWLVHMRHPVRLWRELGTKGFLGFQALMLATPAVSLLNPLMWVQFALWFGWRHEMVPVLFPGPVYYLAAIEFYAGTFFFMFSHAVAMYAVIHDMHRRGDRTFSYGLVKFALIMPVYWALMSIAAGKALWQLVTRPSYWEKTEHGLAPPAAGSPGKGAAA